jgi:hypothetical protein
VLFIVTLATTGVLDAPVYDKWVAALQERGWLPKEPEFEPAPDCNGRYARWRLTEQGREACRELLEENGVLSKATRSP